MVLPRGETAHVTFPRLFDGLELLHARYLTHRLSPHRTGSVSVMLVRDGEWCMTVDGEPHLAPAGSVILMGARDVHDGGPADSGGCELRTFSIADALLHDLVTTRDASCGEVPSAPGPETLDDPTLEETLADLHERLEEDETNTGLDVAFRSCVGGLLQASRIARNGGSGGRTGHAGVRCAVSYIEENYRDAIVVEQMAEIAGLSPFHFIRVFQQDTGLTPHAFLIQVRLERAGDSIRAGVPLSEAATDSGFFDQSHLTRHFKQYYGYTPGLLARACRSS